MRILFVASEVAPWSKTGGLGDVAGALPAAFAALGHEVAVVTPRYLGVPMAGFSPAGAVTLHFPFGPAPFRFHAQWVDGVRVVLADAPPFFARERLYGYADDARRFAAFSMAALAWAQEAGFEADVVQANDWQTGLVPLALKRGYAHTPLGRAASVFTIHNLAYQGTFPKKEVAALGLPWELFTFAGVEFFDHLSFMKAGLQFADRLGTVSPTYAQEIQTRAGGFGLDGVVRARASALVGIVNGVDVREWNPATDVLLPARYSAADRSGKAACRRALLERFGLDAPAPGFPVFGVVGRMVEQKGVDLLQAALPRLLEQGAAAVVVGSGEPRFEAGWRALAARLPRRLGVQVGFDNALAHQVEAGSDFFVMPSRFEPCGLSQLYALLYGAVPIVHATGGLADTVTDVTAGGGTGLAFRPATLDGLFAALVRALELYRRPARYAEVQRRGMAQDLSWGPSARAWLAHFRR